MGRRVLPVGSPVQPDERELPGVKVADTVPEPCCVRSFEGRPERPERALWNGALRGSIERARRLPGHLRVQQVEAFSVTESRKPAEGRLSSFRPVLRVPRDRSVRINGIDVDVVKSRLGQR